MVGNVKTSFLVLKASAFAVSSALPPPIAKMISAFFKSSFYSSFSTIWYVATPPYHKKPKN
ncbi:MAG: hypothetical protein PUE60_08045 [Eubacteriales bacterium]|nr:hypothetical protein [Eubacteriales bacterium]